MLKKEDLTPPHPPSVRVELVDPRVQAQLKLYRRSPRPLSPAKSSRAKQELEKVLEGPAKSSDRARIDQLDAATLGG